MGLPAALAQISDAGLELHDLPTTHERVANGSGLFPFRVLFDFDHVVCAAPGEFHVGLEAKAEAETAVNHSLSPAILTFTVPPGEYSTAGYEGWAYPNLTLFLGGAPAKPVSATVTVIASFAGGSPPPECHSPDALPARKEQAEFEVLFEADDNASAPPATGAGAYGLPWFAVVVVFLLLARPGRKHRR